MISIIVPIYNKQNAIKRCIDSVCSQSYTDWELLLIDDGSTDNSARAIQPYLEDERIRYLYKENGGVSSARNMGIEKAEGEWIIYIDADDYFLPNALETLLEVVSRHQVLIGVGNFWNEKGQLRQEACWGKDGIVRNNFRAWYFMMCMPRAGAAIFNASILKKHLFDVDLTRYEDAKSLFNILREYKVGYTSQKVMVYSLDDLGLSKPVIDISKDYIFSLDFEGKSFWERMLLAHLLNQGFRLYPNHRFYLCKKYASVLYFSFAEFFIDIMCRIRLKLIRCKVNS